MINIKNKKYWNIVKGIGILSIVIGHSFRQLVPLVYMYHLVIFFFLGGYFYNEEKYGDDPYKCLVSKLKSNWTKFFIYSIFFTLIHNILLKLGLIINVDYYHLSNFVSSIINTSLFFGTETLSGALWFVPVYIFATMIFELIIYISRIIVKKYNIDNNYYKDLLIFNGSLLMGLIGCYLIHRNIYLMLHVQTSFLVIPLFFIGYLVKKYIENLNKYLNIIPFILSFMILLLVTYKTGYRVNLSDNITGNYIIFYFISFIGIYFCLYLSKIILKISYLNNYFNMIGNYSFEVMAFHFLIIKLIDFIYSLKGIMNNTISSNIYGKFPYAFEHLGLVYVILGTTIPAFIFWLVNKYKNKYINNKTKIIKKLDNKKILIGMFILLIICIGIPIIKIGIMHNDELMSRFWSLQGFKIFYHHYFIEQIQKGRTLSCFIIPFTMYLGFLGQETISFKLFQIISILLCLLSMNHLLKKIFKDDKFIVLYSLIFLTFLQISFEPTVPNVFVTFYNVSICGLIYSFSLYVDYLNSKNIKKLIFSMIIFFIVELTYESFITYVPIFMLLYIYKNGLKNIFKDKKAILLPILTGIIYLVLYVLFSKLFPSNYDGNQIGNINLINSFKIIYKLGYYTLPGSYLTSDKYQYLLRQYLVFSKKDILRIMTVCILFSIIFIVSLRNTKKNNNISLTKILKVLFISLCLIILPIIPISLASMYQNMKIGVVTYSLPVSFFGYFGAVLAITFIVYYISNKYTLGTYFMLFIMIFMVIGVQTMNSAFSRQANKDFKRIQLIERFITSGIFDEFTGENVYTKDLFITKDALYVHDSHWNSFAQYYNLNVNFINKEGNDNDIKLYFDDNKNLFELIYNGNTYVITENDLNLTYNYCLRKSNTFKLSDKWYIYKKYSNCNF